MTELKTIRTECKNCIFAEYEEKTQTDCTLDLLARFQERGTDVVPVYDEEKEFFIVNGRTCLFCRDHNWAKNIEGNPEDVVKGQVQIKWNLIIYDDGALNEQIRDTIESVKNQILKPNHIIIINNSQGSINFIKPFLNELGIKWTIETIKEENANFGRCLDITKNIFNKNKSVAYNLSCYAGHKLHPSVMYNFNYIVNYQLYQISLVKPKDKSEGLIFNGFLYRLIGGNQGMDFVEKVVTNAELENTSHLIWDYEKVCNYQE